MISKFLKAKHWQLFLLTFGIPLIFQVIMMESMMVKMMKEPNPDPEMIFQYFNYFKFFPLIMIAFMAVLFGWFWSVAIGLQKKIPSSVKMKVRKFKIFFFIPMVYMIFIMLFMAFAIDNVMKMGNAPNFMFIGSVFLIILPIHLFAMFCMFYTMYFVAKTIKTVELQREVSFSDFVGEFFLIWFYVIGVWILQPKINKIAGEENKQYKL